MNLPPDPDNKNDKHAGWAGDTLRFFSSLTGADPVLEAPSDLLANLIHWCDRNDVDFDDLVENARAVYAEETTSQ